MSTSKLMPPPAYFSPCYFWVILWCPMPNPSPSEFAVHFRGGMVDLIIAIIKYSNGYMGELMCINWYLSSWTSFSLRGKKKRGGKVSKWWSNSPRSKILISCPCATSVKSSRPLVSLSSQTIERLLVKYRYIQWLQWHKLQGQLLPYHANLHGSVRQIYGHSGRLCLKHPWYFCLLQFWLWTL